MDQKIYIRGKIQGRKAKRKEEGISGKQKVSKKWDYVVLYFFCNKSIRLLYQSRDGKIAFCGKKNQVKVEN